MKKKSIGARVGSALSRFFTSVWVRNIVISLSMLLSLFLVFIIDTKNGIRKNPFSQMPKRFLKKNQKKLP